MAIAEIICKKYRTSDGKDHDTYSKAYIHETEDSFHEWYNNDHELIGNYEGSIIDSELMLSWIKDNEQFLYNFLDSRKKLIRLD